jgi:dTDP-glucose 4,6-dehydratase
MPEKFLILGANSFYGRNFASLVEESGDIAIKERHYGCSDADYIVNFASKSSVVESWDAPEVWMGVNGSEFSSLIKRLGGANFKKFIHVSTPEVYGSTPYWYEEDEKFDPTTPYAVSRLAGDMMLKAYYKAFGFPMLITRTANIYGPGQQSFRIIPKAIQYKREGKALPLHGGGWSKRSFIHIKDACEATYLLCKEGRIGETYHISTRDIHWIREVVSMIGCEYQEVEDRLGKDAAYMLDSDKIRRLGWSEKIDLEAGLNEIM